MNRLKRPVAALVLITSLPLLMAPSRDQCPPCGTLSVELVDEFGNVTLFDLSIEPHHPVTVDVPVLGGGLYQAELTAFDADADLDIPDAAVSNLTCDVIDLTETCTFAALNDDDVVMTVTTWATTDLKLVVSPQ